MALEGADTVYIANTASRFIFRLYGEPSIKTVADLKENLACHSTGRFDGLRQSHVVAAVRIGAG